MNKIKVKKSITLINKQGEDALLINVLMPSEHDEFLHEMMFARQVFNIEIEGVLASNAIVESLTNDGFNLRTLGFVNVFKG